MPRRIHSARCFAGRCLAAWLLLAPVCFAAGAGSGNATLPAAGAEAGNATLPAAGAEAGNAPLPAAGAEVLDRTIAVVNHHVITWSDLDEQMRFEALENARPLSELGEADRRAAFDRLVQDWILRDQMQGMLPVADADVDARIAALRADWKMENDDGKWNATLERYGITPAELRALAAEQIEILRFLDFRVRPLVRVSRQEIEDYYNSTLVPQVHAKGQSPEPLDQLRSKIRELLTEQKVSQETDKWLQTLRAQSHVQLLWDGVR